MHTVVRRYIYVKKVVGREVLLEPQLQYLQISHLENFLNRMVKHIRLDLIHLNSDQILVFLDGCNV